MGRELEGRIALVIGGSRGIGFALARGLAEAGAHVAVAARTETAVREAAQRLSHLTEARGYAADVTRRDVVEGLRDSVGRDLGPTDILVNCQGITVVKPVLDITDEEYDRVLDTNLRSVFVTCTVIGAEMIGRGGGAIVNIASLAAHRGWPGSVPYCLSKHGVLGLTRSLAAEWAEHRLRVNSISPGVFLTDLNRDRMPEARKQSALARTPMTRFGEVEELVGAVRYLASDAAAYVTGTDIAVDGGYLAGGI